MNQSMNVRIQAPTPSPSSAFPPPRRSPQPTSILPRATCSSQAIFHGAGLQTEASSDVNSSSITCLVSKDTFGWSRTRSLFLKQPLNKYSFSLHALMTSKPQDVSASSLIGEGKIGVLLLNLGGPETLDDVQPFLFNLFADPDIIRLPRLFRFLQKPLAQFISVARAPKSKEGYAAIGGGSPLRRITDAQAWFC